MAAASASCPVTGRRAGSIWAPFMAAMAPPAMPSLATYTPSKPSLLTAVMACYITYLAVSGLQTGVLYWGSILTTAAPRTLRASFLYGLLLLSVCGPLILTVLGLTL